MTVAVVALFGSSHVDYAHALVESLRGNADRVVLVHASAPGAALRLLGRRADLVAYEHGDDGETTRSGRAAGKLVAWEAGLAACVDGDEVAFLDADTFVCRPLVEAFAQSFDVAHTVRDGRRWLVNSGVVFVRATLATRIWIADWRRAASNILADPSRRQRAIDHYGAPDQAALVGTLTSAGLAVATLPGETWNEDWISADPSRVRIWHLKGALPSLLAGAPDPRDGQVVWSDWRAAHRRATQ